MMVIVFLFSNWIEIVVFCELLFFLWDIIDKNVLLYGFIGEKIKEEILDKIGFRFVVVFEWGFCYLIFNWLIRYFDDL